MSDKAQEKAKEEMASQELKCFFGTGDSLPAQNFY